MPTGKGLERKVFHLAEMKAVDSAEGIFSGYLSYNGNLDENGDIVDAGAFKKTLSEAHEVKQRTKRKFLYPLLWMHDRSQPAGGFTEMREDVNGLYVEGKCDLRTELGRMVFSGMQEGYIGGLSVGYDTIQAVRDSKGRKHLTEMRIWEGSAITTGFEANHMALVQATKQAQDSTDTLLASAAQRTLRREMKQKSVGGKTSWPLGAQDASWDNGAAHKAIMAWATKDDGSLDEGKMKSVHFWYDSSAADKAGSYKLLFCDVINGAVKAMPKAIEACTGSHGIAGIKGVSSGDMAGIKSRISGYYSRMRKEFKDDNLTPSFEAKKQAWKHDVKQSCGLQTVISCLSSINYSYANLDDALEALGDAVGRPMDLDDGEQQPGAVMDADVEPAVQILLDNLPGLNDALTALAVTSQAFDDALDTILSLFGLEDASQDDSQDSAMMAYMAALPVLSYKAGRALSASNAAKIRAVADGLGNHRDTLMNMVGYADDPNQGFDMGSDPAMLDGMAAKPGTVTYASDPGNKAANLTGPTGPTTTNASAKPEDRDTKVADTTTSDDSNRTEPEDDSTLVSDLHDFFNEQAIMDALRQSRISK